MPMTVRFNPKQLEVNIRQIGEMAVKGMAAKMKVTAIKIRDLARDYAPVKSGALERAIEWAVVKDGRRDAYVVYINLDMPRDDGRPGVVGDYAWIMEEQLHPYGRKAGTRYFRLGAGSIAKAATGKKVGGRFLSRAVKEGTRGLEQIMAREVQRVLGSSRTIPMQFTRPEVETDQ